MNKMYIMFILNILSSCLLIKRPEDRPFDCRVEIFDQCGGARDGSIELLLLLNELGDGAPVNARRP